MPKRTDIRTIMVIGSGPIVIGQGCEFDYSGVQACKVLRREGYRIVLVPKSSGLRRILSHLTVSLNADGVIQQTDATLPKGDRVLTRYKNVRPSKQSDVKFDFTPPPDAHVSTPLGN